MSKMFILEFINYALPCMHNLLILSTSSSLLIGKNFFPLSRGGCSSLFGLSWMIGVSTANASELTSREDKSRLLSLALGLQAS